MPSGMVAVPYYGTLYRAKFGYERIFFFLNFCGRTDSYSEARLGVWDNRKDEALTDWLKRNGIDSVVCSDYPEASLLQRMESLGIEIITGNNSEGRRLMRHLMI